MKVFRLPYGDDESLSRDEQFLQELNTILEAHLEAEKFNIKELTEAMSMSQIRIYRKLKRLTGKSINQYVREYRLEHAMKLLIQDVASVSEIAYQVGFGSPAYFNKCFHDHYGFPPGEVKDHISIDKLSDGKMQKEFILAKTSSRTIPYFRYGLFVLAGLALLFTALFYFIPWSNEITPVEIHERKSIAVLPFRNDSRDPANNFICSNLEEEILNQLQKINGIIVRPQQMVDNYPESVKELSTIKKELEVDYIVQGSLLKFGDTIRFWIKLIDTHKNIQLWMESFNIPFKTDNIYAVHSSIAVQVVESMGGMITRAELERITRRYPPDIKALEFYWRGVQEMRNYWRNWERDPSHLNHARELFNQALLIDPEFPDALSAKGNTFILNQMHDSARFYIQKASQLDPDNIMVLNSFAEYYERTGSLDLAIENYERIIELKPNEFRTLTRLGMINMINKQDIPAGLPYLEKALKLYPGNDMILSGIGYACLFIGNYEKADEYLLKAIQNGDNKPCIDLHFYSLSLIAQNRMKDGIQMLDTLCRQLECMDKCSVDECWFLIFLEKFEEASIRYNKLVEEGIRFQLFDSIFLAHMYNNLGKEKEFHQVISYCKDRYEKMLAENPENIDPILNIPWVYAQLNDRENMLKYFRKFEETGFHIGIQDMVSHSSIFDPYRDDPELNAILAREREKKAAMRTQVRKMERSNW